MYEHSQATPQLPGTFEKGVLICLASIDVVTFVILAFSIIRLMQGSSTSRYYGRKSEKDRQRKGCKGAERF